MGHFIQPVRPSETMEGAACRRLGTRRLPCQTSKDLFLEKTLNSTNIFFIEHTLLLKKTGAKSVKTKTFSENTSVKGPGDFFCTPRQIPVRGSATSCGPLAAL